MMNSFNERRMNVELQQKLLRTEVTCLMLLDNHVISGMGGLISIFNIDSTKLVTQLKVFEDSKVHGLCKGSEKYIVAFGGRRIAVICCDFDSGNILQIKKFWYVNDWIHCVQWLQDENIAIATAHNTVILWNWKMNEELMTAYCEEKCILYCSSLVGSKWEELVVLAGTVFQEVIIWSPTNGSNTDLHCPVLQRLQGHKGVIFSSHYNPETGRIHTTSDDRSVKGWQVNPPQPNNWQLADIKLIYTLYGHSARVWKSIGLRECTISIGEDSHVCVWSVEGKLLKRCSMHQGGSIWSIACSEQKALLVTGGSDGSIIMLSLDYWAKNLNPMFSVPLDGSCLDKVTEQAVPRRVILLKTGHMITVLQSGHVMHCFGQQSNVQLFYDKDTAEDEVVDQDKSCACPSDEPVWSVIYFSLKLASYCLLEVSTCRQRFALGSLDGQIVIFEESTLCEPQKTNLMKIVDVPAVEGKIFSLQWLSPNIILTCEAFGRLCMWSLLTSEDGSFYLKIMKTLILPYSKERWVTAAFLYDNFLICGDRLGNIHLYSLQKEISENSEPCQTLSKVHSRLGVSHLMAYCNCIYSSGRDGTLRQYQILKMHKRLKQLCVTRMPFDWVSSFCKHTNDILVLGFSEKNFVVWSQQQQRLLFELPCGGGHRSWDYIVRGSTMIFVHIKLKSLFVALLSLKLCVKPFLQTGFHPREVNCLQTLNKNNKQFPILLSGGEDTTIRVTSINSQNQFQTLAVLQSHISSVRTLVCCELPENKILMFSAGGRAQIKGWELTYEQSSDNPESLPDVVCKELSSHMLMDCNHKQSKSWKLLQPTLDPETRYMSICIVLHEKVVFVAAGCSDGYLRVLHYDKEKQTFQVVGSFNFHHRCILNVACISPLKVLTMATDGIVAFWDLTVLVQKYMTSFCCAENTEHKNSHFEDYKLEPFSNCKLHQSGIDSYDIFTLDLGHYLMATGGDDTALVITAFRFLENTNSVNQVLQWRMESAHVAQITGLTFVDQYLVSTSVDQKVFIWKWLCDVNKRLLLVSKVAECYSSIADIHGLRAWSNRDSLFLCLFGKGVEIIQGNSTNEDEKENNLTFSVMNS